VLLPEITTPQLHVVVLDDVAAISTSKFASIEPAKPKNQLSWKGHPVVVQVEPLIVSQPDDIATVFGVLVLRTTTLDWSANAGPLASVARPIARRVDRAIRLIVRMVSVVLIVS
jgi:hypothetical protein